jgi:hypothetical protein
MVYQSGSGSGAQDPFEMFRRLWAPLGLPVPGMAMPTLDPAEVEKRIADLKSVETWLGMNLNMVKMAIQGLEVQKMALYAMKSNAGAAGDAANASDANPLANPMFWPWAMMQGAAAPERPAEPKSKDGKERKEGK